MKNDRMSRGLRRALAEIQARLYGLCEACEAPLGYRRSIRGPLAGYCPACRYKIQKETHEAKIFADSAVMTAQ